MKGMKVKRPNRGKIENWKVYDYGNSTKVVTGTLYSVENYEGSISYVGPIRTSRIVKLAEDESFVETLNSFYELGTKCND